MSNTHNPIYRVVEEVGEVLEGKIITLPDWHQSRLTLSNAHGRIYPTLAGARAMRTRMAKQGRKGRILKFVYESEVE